MPFFLAQRSTLVLVIAFCALSGAQSAVPVVCVPLALAAASTKLKSKLTAARRRLECAEMPGEAFDNCMNEMYDADMCEARDDSTPWVQPTFSLLDAQIGVKPSCGCMAAIVACAQSDTSCIVKASSYDACVSASCTAQQCGSAILTTSAAPTTTLAPIETTVDATRASELVSSTSTTVLTAAPAPIATTTTAAANGPATPAPDTTRALNERTARMASDDENETAAPGQGGGATDESTVPLYAWIILGAALLCCVLGIGIAVAHRSKSSDRVHAAGPLIDDEYPRTVGETTSSFGLTAMGHDALDGADHDDKLVRRKSSGRRRKRRKADKRISTIEARDAGYGEVPAASDRVSTIQAKSAGYDRVPADRGECTLCLCSIGHSHTARAAALQYDRVETMRDENQVKHGYDRVGTNKKPQASEYERADSKLSV